MTEEHYLINSIVNYANLVTGFAVAQSMLFLFAIGKETAFRDRIIFWRKTVIRFFITSGVLYQFIIVYLGISEQIFRSIDGHSMSIKTFSISIVIGRMLVLLLFGFICIFASNRIGTKNSPEKQAKNSFERDA